MKRWILVTSGKGGVGKSLIARVIAEAKRETEPDVASLDLPPINSVNCSKTLME
jgi:MinD-like ATPase involved in chromosome partitioning or flagellar assembly